MDQAQERFEEALKISNEINDQQAVGMLRFAFGQLARQKGNLEAADSCFREAYQIAGAVEDRQLESMALNYQGRLAHQRGQMQTGDKLRLRSQASVGMRLVWRGSSLRAEARQKLASLMVG